MVVQRCGHHGLGAPLAARNSNTIMMMMMKHNHEHREQ
jgi:hypothetical protein